jgi:hypothetical protein
MARAVLQCESGTLNMWLLLAWAGDRKVGRKHPDQKVTHQCRCNSETAASQQSVAQQTYYPKAPIRQPPGIGLEGRGVRSQGDNVGGVTGRGRHGKGSARWEASDGAGGLACCCGGRGTGVRATTVADGQGVLHIGREALLPRHHRGRSGAGADGADDDWRTAKAMI